VGRVFFASRSSRETTIEEGTVKGGFNPTKGLWVIKRWPEDKGDGFVHIFGRGKGVLESDNPQ